MLKKYLEIAPIIAFEILCLYINLIMFHTPFNTFAAILCTIFNILTVLVIVGKWRF